MFLRLFIPVFFIIIVSASCSSDYTPKPKGFLRIDLPEKKYKMFKGLCPYSFEYPEYALIEYYKKEKNEPYWLNIFFPKLKAKIHLSYKPVNKDVDKFIEDSRTLAYKHSIKADAINENIVVNNKEKVYGMIYDIKGNSASSVQFFLTDSVKHFLRGALYFNAEPNKDSLQPVINFIHKDITHLIETFHWEK